MKYICKIITFSAMVWMITGISTCRSIAYKTKTKIHNTIEQKRIASDLKSAIKKGDYSKVKELFNKYDVHKHRSIANTEIRLFQYTCPNIDYVQESILYFAIFCRNKAKENNKNKYLEIIEFLLENEANPNLPRKRVASSASRYIDSYPLTIATRARDVLVVKLLLTHGANINSLDNPEADYAQICGSALHIAMSNGDIPILEILLAHKGLDINQPIRESWLPLQAGIVSYEFRRDTNQVKAVRLLLRDKRTDVNKKESFKEKTSLFLAVECGLIEMVEVLLEHPAIDMEQKNSYGRTPLVEAVHGSYVEIVKLLLNRGANPEGITLTKWGAFLSKLGSAKRKEIQELLAKAKQNQNKTKAFKYIFDPIDVTKEDGICSICHTELVDASAHKHAIALKCKHKFHLDCIAQWVKPSTATCLLCREKIK
ncbi:ankyrin repeat domain-containing protein [Cardinium endosymbiont of Culicoides punctatus]|uniref:ankyrin repeat domain-containing protein n=1 Tax=Cardinium endosymbiont of Culicoides punctatus TaxID=2304601 RepID=UPI0010583F0C|nr:ankyrin repeat domain-containing protein [Cardinium endosymbiont of Culicoides punctatus]TDG94187.1 hypothetical protein CCPUN_08320 [Cardinium endosymbiont of Culicoides punctatus]